MGGVAGGDGRGDGRPPSEREPGEETTAMSTETKAYTYPAILEVSERINWRVEDLIGGDKRLDFSRPFLPESLARVEPLGFLAPTEKRALNHIRGANYLHMFGLVEEFILPFVLDHARQDLHGDSYQVRSFLEFAGEEAKHIHLFRQFREAFERGFGTPCEQIGPAEAIAQAVLKHDPLAVALVILHIEWFVQSHYVDSVRDDQELDPLFKSLLKHHWMEEAQHARLDTLMIRSLARGRAPASISRAVDEYLEIGGMIDGGLRQQVELDLASFERATGRRLTAPQRDEFGRVQLQALRWTFLGSGMTHPKFLETLGELSPADRRRIEDVAPVFC
jgi:hypothetical protein